MELKNYRAFVKAFLWIITIFLFVLHMIIICKPMSYMDNLYPEWVQQKNYLMTDSDEQEILFLGDSQVKSGIIPRNISNNTYNLAMGGASPIEMYYALKTYLMHHPKPICIIISFASPHYREVNAYKLRTIYYNYLNGMEVLESQKDIIVQNNLSRRSAVKNYIEDLRYILREPTKYMPAITKSKFSREADNLMIYDNVQKEQGYRVYGTAEGSSELNGDEKLKEFKILPSNKYYLEKIVSLCRSNNIPLVLEQTPINKSTFTNLNENYKFEYEEAMKELEKIEGIISVNTNFLVYDDKYFGDMRHLNPIGAEKYTEYIKKKYLNIFN